MSWFGPKELPSRMATKDPLQTTYVMPGRAWSSDPVAINVQYRRYNGLAGFNQPPIWNWPHTYDNMSYSAPPVVYTLHVNAGTAAVQQPNPIYNLIATRSQSTLG